MVVVLGSSASGKSTTLRCVNLLEIPDEGAIYLDGQKIGRDWGKGTEYPAAEQTKVRGQVRMVFQQFNLFPHLTVEQNVMLGLLKVRKLGAAEARAIAHTCLDRVGMADKAGRYPAALSGGQQQRVAIARAVAMQPTLMFWMSPRPRSTRSWWARF